MHDISVLNAPAKPTELADAAAYAAPTYADGAPVTAEPP